MSRDGDVTEQLRGRVTHFKRDAGYGLVRGEDGRQFFFHREDVVAGRVKPGTEVFFSPSPPPPEGLARARAVRRLGPHPQRTPSRRRRDRAVRPVVVPRRAVLFVRHLPLAMTKREVAELFEAAGVSPFKVTLPPSDDALVRSAMVAVPEDQAEAACAALDGREVEGRAIRVNRKAPPQ